MTKFKLKVFLKVSYQLILVFLQFTIIAFHFFEWKLFPIKQIMQVTPISYFMGILIIIISSIIILVAMKDLGINLSPFPRPITNSNLFTRGIYGFTRHPMYHFLIFFSFGFFIKKLSIYYLSLSLSLALIIKFKIVLEEHYLNNKYKNYLLSKNEVKY